MVQKLNNGYWLFTGQVSKDATFKTVGQNDTPLCEFSVYCGKKENGDKIYFNCKAWYELAGIFRELLKNDAFAGIAKEKRREYNGKTYVDFEIEWGNSPMLCGNAPAPEQGADADEEYPVPDDYSDADFLRELADDDEEPAF